GYYHEHEGAASLTLKRAGRLSCQRTGSFQKIIWKGEPVWCVLFTGNSACYSEILISMAENSTSLSQRQAVQRQPGRMKSANGDPVLPKF
ncbi:MAG: hypothetical protein ACK5PS_13300, partial [Desulfopila sp.]